MADRPPLDVLEAIHSTRAMRYLSPEPIPDGVIWEILDAAIRAPTGGNEQGWGWLVIRDPETKRQMAEGYRAGIASSYGYDVVSDEKLPTGDTGIDARNRRAVVHLAENYADVPVFVAAILTGVGPDAGPGTGGGIYGAVQNLALAARAHGIGTVLTTGGITEAVRDRLGLPANARVMAVLPLGYPARGSFSQPRRRPVEEVVHWDRWEGRRPRDAS